LGVSGFKAAHTFLAGRDIVTAEDEKVLFGRWESRMGERNFKITPRKEPIFITKNGYSDLVVMSSELYDRFARINRIDQAIYESEKEMQEGGEAIDLDDAIHALNKKYYG
jgi:hypothetical protein